MRRRQRVRLAFTAEWAHAIADDKASATIAQKIVEAGESQTRVGEAVL
jgi:hypothetical protein